MMYNLLKESVVLRRWLLVGLILAMVMLPVGVYWGVQRASSYSRWQTQFRLAQSFTFILEDCSGLLQAGPETLSESALVVAGNDLSYAGYSLDALMRLDWDHVNQLDRIGYALVRLQTNLSTYVGNLTIAQRNTLSGLLHTLADKILSTYADYARFTGGNPSLLYFGPSPPDENLLKQAVDLAINWPGLPSLPT